MSRPKLKVPKISTTTRFTEADLAAIDRIAAGSRSWVNRPAVKKDCDVLSFCIHFVDQNFAAITESVDVQQDV